MCVCVCAATPCGVAGVHGRHGSRIVVVVGEFACACMRAFARVCVFAEIGVGGAPRFLIGWRWFVFVCVCVCVFVCGVCVCVCVCHCCCCVDFGKDGHDHDSDGHDHDFRLGLPPRRSCKCSVHLEGGPIRGMMSREKRMMHTHTHTRTPTEERTHMYVCMYILVHAHVHAQSNAHV